MAPIEDEDDGDGENQPTMILFLSPIGKEILTTAVRWYSYGTFSTAPPPYTQLYVLFGELASGKALPCFYALLPNKEMNTYKRMWSILSTALGQPISLQSAMMDMEVAASKSLIQVFGNNINIAICYFHIRKA